MKKLCYVSDVHLEFWKKNVPVYAPPSVEGGRCYLALCGDIGYPFTDMYGQFLRVHSSLYDHVFVLAGNHEYYSRKKTIREINNRIHEVCAGLPNVTFLDQTGATIETDGSVLPLGPRGLESPGAVRILGCTLWSPVSKEIESQMNDYKYIHIGCPYSVSRAYRTSPVEVTPCAPTVVDVPGGVVPRNYTHRRLLQAADVNRLHDAMVAWLRDILSTGPRTIVLTHHAPTPLMDRNPPHPGYSSQSEFLMGGPVSHWISGHTHITRRIVVGTTECLSNCIGYPSEPTESQGLVWFTL